MSTRQSGREPHGRRNEARKDGHKTERVTDRKAEQGEPQGEERGVRAAMRDRTRGKLMSNAIRLMRDGRMPSVPEVAQEAGVSRATAYRYFSSRSHLITAVVAEALGPVRSFEPNSSDGHERIRELFDRTFPRFTEFETQLRAAMVLALEHQWQERSGNLEEEPFRRGHRVGILKRVAAPMRPQLGARGFDRLLKALSLVYGIESWIVLKDIWGCSDSEVESVSRWVVDALVDRAAADSVARGTAGRTTPAKRSPTKRSPVPRTAAARTPATRTTIGRATTARTPTPLAPDSRPVATRTRVRNGRGDDQ